MIGSAVLVIVGVVLLLNTLVGGLPRRLLQLGGESDGVLDGSSNAGPTSSRNVITGNAGTYVPPTTTGGRGITPSMALIDREISAAGFNLRNDAGVVVCREKNLGDGRYGGGWSEHSYGNAGDYYGTPEQMQRLYLWALRNRGRLPIGTVCYNGQGPCSHPHTDHVHIDAKPSGAGRPPGC